MYKIIKNKNKKITNKLEEFKMNNIPQVKLGIVAVSRDCLPIELSASRRKSVVQAYNGEIFECQTTIENEKDGFFKMQLKLYLKKIHLAKRL